MPLNPRFVYTTIEKYRRAEIRQIVEGRVVYEEISFMPDHNIAFYRKIMRLRLGKIIEPRGPGDLVALLHYYTNPKCHFSLPHLPASLSTA
ncbi:uncharacterized protein G2W53_017588 [Senna tora]|uniref:Uncharacterized protein n=1 Tax=Senna tora TaxID=362788 RepID=A0A834TYS8_9FABA|nr:uncharacterized protein G2W53_017588 [Senna tora]